MSIRPSPISRRQFIRSTAAGVLASTLIPGHLLAMEGMSMTPMPKLPPNRANPQFRPDVEVEMLCVRKAIPILSGAPTQVMMYQGRVLSGPEDALVPMPHGYLGPLLRLQKGQKVRVHLRNALGEPTITHWHGLHVPPEMDGHPMYAIDDGETFVYEFEVKNRACFMFYHPHTHGKTASQVYFGMAGGMIVHDEEEARLNLPSGAYEIPLVLQDRRFDAQNQLVYVHSMHERMTGFHGDRILVNGQPDVKLAVESRAYRLRLVNGSNARIFKLAWDDGSPMMVIGVDGGLLEAPLHKPYVMLAPGERLDVWADFSGRRKGTELALKSLAYHGLLPRMAEGGMMQGGSGHVGGGMGGMGGGMGGMGGMGGGHGGGMGGSMMMQHGQQQSGHKMGGMGGMGMSHGADALAPGSEFEIMRFQITQETSDSPALPHQLSVIERYTLDDVANPGKPVPIAISEGPMAMLLNGRPYAMDDFLPEERIPVNTLQLMEIFHNHGGEGGGHGSGHGGSGGMNMAAMMSMAHPIHIHEQPFQIISRSMSDDGQEAYASVHEGLVDSGWKDTVLVLPGERVRIIKPFREFKGRYMMHCHNLEHEDMGMMRDLLVE